MSKITVVVSQVVPVSAVSGEPVNPFGATIDDNAGSGSTSRTWSADKVAREILAAKSEAIAAIPSGGGGGGGDGRQVQLQKTPTHVQWRYSGDLTWTNLIALSELVGATGSAGSTGASGANGTNGTNGSNAKELELQKTLTHIQWRRAGEAWNNLALLTDLQGAAGTNGVNGTNGSNGVNGTNGSNGKSAYELAVDQGFVGTQAAWLASLSGSNGTNGTNGVDGSDFDYAPVAFSTVIDLSSAKVMAPTTITSALVFTSTGAPAVFKPTYVRLTANGTNTPDFSNFSEWGVSLGWVNTAGTVNFVNFFSDGVENFYSVIQKYTSATSSPAPAPDPAPGPGPTPTNTPQLEIRSGMSESGNSTDGYNYTATSNGWSSYAVSAINSMAGDGYIQCVFTASNGILAFKTTGTGANYTGSQYGVYVDSASNTPKVIINGSGGNSPNVSSNFGFPTWNMYRLRRSGTTLYIEASNNGTAWSSVHTYTGASGELFPMVSGYNSGDGVTKLRSEGLA